MTHERGVERFYSWGVERYGTFHENYLNFGLWADGDGGYVRAAEALLERVGTMAGLAPGAVLLDVACGMGTQDRYFLERFGCAAIEAVDVTRKHIEIARRRHAHDAITFRVGNACALPFSDAHFTHATAIEGIVHVHTRGRFFREAHRVLRPGGRLGVADFFIGRPPRNRFEARLVAWGAKAWHVPAENLTTVDAYRRSLETAGFGDVALDVVSDAVIPGYVAEQRRREVRRAIYKIRGAVVGRLGVVIDHLVSQLHRRGLVGYLVGAASKA